MIDLIGKVVLITGGSRGIGAATAHLLAQAGADIAITYNKNKRAALKVQRDVESLGPECLVFKADVANAKHVRSTVQKVYEHFRGIDILVNNAGVWTRGAIGKMKESVWDQTIDTNLKGTFLFCNEVVPYMKKKNDGRIINIASTAGQRGEAFHSHYAASKGGMIAFTKSIGAELAPFNIYANCIAPGWVDTDMSRSSLRVPAHLKKIVKTIPNGRVANSEDIAGAVLYLASSYATHLVGSTVSINGGGVMVG